MTALPAKAEIEAERAKRSLRRFFALAWQVLEPGTPFLPNWHIDAICDLLEAVVGGETRRVLINLPPRHGKSLLTSIALVAWVWASDPARKFLCASYGERPAAGHALRTRWLLESAWYRERWGHVFSLRSDQNEKTRFFNDRLGHRIAVSPGGVATGEGGDIVVFDDPHKIEDAESDAMREAAVDFFFGTLSTRLNEPRKGTFVIVGHRVHHADLFGQLIGQGGWDHICLPAEYEPSHPFRWPSDPRTEPGELLWPDRTGREELEELKRHLGSYRAAAQLQQRPSPPGGSIFERRWFRWYDPDRPLPRFDSIIQSWDLAFTDTPGADFVVGQAWGRVGPDRYLLAEHRARLSFPETVEAVERFAQEVKDRFPHRGGQKILVEEAANGYALVRVLNQRIQGVIGRRPRGNKAARAHAVSPQLEAGNV
ncbi:MAG: hypothetical protein LC790_21695, partial [Actinobacteria bacterium]|nr:hypothetical protein [Actinomycetota bacterium]